jgi:hypothetical protein
MSATHARREYEHAAVRNQLLRYAIELHSQSRDVAVRRRLPRIRAVGAVSDANLRMLEQGLGSLTTPAQYDWSRRRSDPSAARIVAMFGSWEVALNRAGLAGPVETSAAVRRVS